MNLVLPRSFFLRTNVVQIARELIGKFIVTNFDDQVTSGLITETEAYKGVTDKASHAFGNRFTRRTEVMYREGGIAYVYLCYGIHSLFNIVTHHEGIPHAVLIRAIQPADGQEMMLKRIGKKTFYQSSGKGPGNVTRLLGIHYSHTGMDLCSDSTDVNEKKIWIENRGVTIRSKDILVTSRIGVDYAEEDALLPYRFVLGND